MSLNKRACEEAAFADSSERIGIRLRSPKAEDAPVVFKIAEECGLSFWSETDYRTESSRENSFAAVAEIDKEKEVVGFIIARLIITKGFDSNQLNVVPTEDKKTKYNSDVIVEAEIYNIAVSEKLRRKRVGESLLNALLKFVSGYGDGNFVIWLEVRNSNAAAIKFYRANNFEVAYTRKNFYRNPSEDALVLRLRNLLAV